MNADRLRQLEAVAGLQRVRLEQAQLHAAGLRRELERTRQASERSQAERAGIDAQWRAALGRNAGLDLAAIAGWRALAAEAQRRCDDCEAAQRQAQDAADAFAHELLRLRCQRDRSDEDAARERAWLARKREEKLGDAALERHNARLHDTTPQQAIGTEP